MKKILTLLMMVMSITFLFAQKNAVRSAKVISSEVNWWGYKVVKTVPTTHNGTVKLKSGKFNFKDNLIVDGEFVIDMRSITVSDLAGEDQIKLTNDLKSTNFFEVKKFPIAKFHLTKILPSNSTEYNSIVYGNITIKGIRKTISFPASVIVKGQSVEFESAKFTLNRQDFKAFYKSSLKDYLIKDEMDIQISMKTK